MHANIESYVVGEGRVEKGEVQDETSPHSHLPLAARRARKAWYAW